MNKTFLFTATLSLLAVGLHAEDYIDFVKTGNEALKAGDYRKALENYHIAEAEIPASPELEYNIGSALTGQQSYEEAVAKLTNALTTQDVMLESAAHYNLGNTHYLMGDYPKAIESYTKALDKNPDDMDAKFNLELARKMLKENMKPNEDGEQGQDQKQQQEQQQEQPMDEQELQEPKPKDQAPPGDNEDKQTEGEQEYVRDESKPMSKEDAERILNALKNDEQETQKKIKRARTRSSYLGKDW